MPFSFRLFGSSCEWEEAASKRARLCQLFYLWNSLILYTKLFHREPSREHLVAIEKEEKKNGSEKIALGYNLLCTKFQNLFSSPPLSWAEVAGCRWRDGCPVPFRESVGRMCGKRVVHRTLAFFTHKRLRGCPAFLSI